MANYKARNGLLQGWQINVAEMMFRGWNDEKIAVEQFRVDPNDKKALNRAKGKIYRLRRTTEFREYYKTLIDEWSVKHVGKALSTLAAQMDDKNGWLANKACNDILTQSKNFTGVEDNSVVIRIEGAPELGVPKED